MKKKKLVIFFLFFFIALISYFFFDSNSIKENNVNITETKKEDFNYSSNIIKDVNYVTKDVDGNEYTISALQGEIDYSNPNILFLSKVNALIKLKNSEIITITSDYGKYNSENYDTIFSQNVIVNYLENNITSEYLDFSLKRNSMIISKKVVYTNLDNILKADVVEINVKTKDTKIYMYEKQKKVNIKSKN